MTRIPRLDVLDRRAVCAIAGAAFVLGFLLASVVPNAIRADYEVILPERVVAQIRELTDHWCRDFGGLDPHKLYLVGKNKYSWDCNEFARYRNVRIHTKQ